MTPAPLLLPGRLAGLDAGRVAAAIAVVWLHTAGIGPRVAPAGTAGRFAVPFFTFIAAALIADRCTRGTISSPAKFVRDRIVRLYLPFVLWTAVYLGLRMAKHLLRPAGPAPPLGPHLLVVGSAHHLWYLSFLLLMSVAVRIVTPLLVGTKRPAVLACLTAGVAVALTPLARPHDPMDAGFINQFNYLVVLGWVALPAALWGVAVGLDLVRVTTTLANRPVAAVALVFLAVGLLVPGDNFPGRVLRENLSGMAVVAACLALPVGHRMRQVAAWGRHAFGVYAVHVAIILALEAVLVRDRADFSIGQAVTIFVGAVAGSFATSALLTRSRWSAWAVS